MKIKSKCKSKLELFSNIGQIVSSIIIIATFSLAVLGYYGNINRDHKNKALQIYDDFSKFEVKSCSIQPSVMANVAFTTSEAIFLHMPKSVQWQNTILNILYEYDLIITKNIDPNTIDPVFVQFLEENADSLYNAILENKKYPKHWTIKNE